MLRPDVAELLKDEVAGKGRAFFDEAGSTGRIRIVSAPARLDVLGGLGAEAGGTVAQMALPTRLALAVQLTDRPLLAIHSDQIFPPLGESRLEIPLAHSALGDAPLSPAVLATLAPGAKSWAAPIVALWHVLEHAYPTPQPAGAAIMIKSDIPMGAGQASSAALLTTLLLALSTLRKIPANRLHAAQLAQHIQRADDLAGGTGGLGRLLDASTCLLADSDHPAILRYSSQPCELIGRIPLPRDLRILALDTGMRYHSARQTLDELHIAAAMGLRMIETIYRDLGQSHTPLHGYLANTSPLLYRQYFRALLPRRMRGSDFIRTYGTPPDSAAFDLTHIYRVRTAVDHLIAENEHAEQFLQTMEELAQEPARPGRGAKAAPAVDHEERHRTLLRAGRLLLASHHSYRLRLELSSREADWLVDRLMDAGPDRGIYGARITGCGGGGTVMALVDRSPAAGDTILEVMQGYRQVTDLSLGIVEAGGPASSGALSPGSSITLDPDAKH